MKRRTAQLIAGSVGLILEVIWIWFLSNFGGIPLSTVMNSTDMPLLSIALIIVGIGAIGYIAAKKEEKPFFAILLVFGILMTLWFGIKIILMSILLSFIAIGVSILIIWFASGLVDIIENLDEPPRFRMDGLR